MFCDPYLFINIISYRSESGLERDRGPFQFWIHVLVRYESEWQNFILIFQSHNLHNVHSPCVLLKTNVQCVLKPDLLNYLLKCAETWSTALWECYTWCLQLACFRTLQQVIDAEVLAFHVSEWRGARWHHHFPQKGGGEDKGNELPPISPQSLQHGWIWGRPACHVSKRTSPVSMGPVRCAVNELLLCRRLDLQLSGVSGEFQTISVLCKTLQASFSTMAQPRFFFTFFGAWLSVSASEGRYQNLGMIDIWLSHCAWGRT